MSHPNDGSLRRMQDEPFSVPESVSRHVEACPRCQVRLQEMSANSAAASHLLSVSPLTVNVDSGLSRVRTAVAVAPAARRRSFASSLVDRIPLGRKLGKPGLALALAALAVTIVAASVGGAENLLTIFQPQQAQPIPVTSAELQQLPDLASFGTVKVITKGQNQTAPDAAAAANLSGLDLLAPSYVPASVSSHLTYQVLGKTSGSFTFDAAKAQAAASKDGKTLPAMPANIDGSTLFVTAGPGVAAIYGPEGQTPQLVIAQGRAPEVTSTGVSVKELEDYLVTLPGVSPQLAAAIKAIGDPSTTLPVPVPIDKANAQQVTVQGTRGVLVGDSTGVGSGVVWFKNGMAYAVGGTLSQTEVLAVANSLK